VVVSYISIGGYEFHKVCALEVERDSAGAVKKFMPQDRYAQAATTPLNSYGKGPFVKFKIPRALKASGVYALTVDGTIKYIGEASNLSSRFNMGYGNISPRNCYKGGQETNCRLNNLIYHQVVDGRDTTTWFHKTVDYKKIEAELRRTQHLEWNKA
jgi:hypothetical protein